MKTLDIFKNSYRYFPLFSLLLATSAFAQTEAAAATEPSFLKQIPIFVAFFLIFYFAILRPQSQAAKKQKEFLLNLDKGAEVVTSSGIIGTVVGINDRVVTLEVSDGNELRLLKSQVQAYLKDSLSNQTPKAQAR